MAEDDNGLDWSGVEEGEKEADQVSMSFHSEFVPIVTDMMDVETKWDKKRETTKTIRRVYYKFVVPSLMDAFDYHDVELWLCKTKQLGYHTASIKKRFKRK